MADASAIFRLEGVTKRYGEVTALRDVTLAFSGNEYVSLLGPSGSGKTTLLRVIAGFEVPDAGRVYFEGRDITALPAHERGIGFVFQNFALFPHLTVYQNVSFGLTHGNTTVAASEIDRRTRSMIELVGMAGMEGRGIDQISGGQKQRVALARTLVMEPRFVLLDEPLGALDANLRGRMRNELRAIREKLGVTFLHVTGSETEALSMGDRVVVLDNGTIAQFAHPDEVYAAPASANVAHFLNRYNLFPGKISDGAITGAFGTVRPDVVRRGDRPVCAVRYDRINVAAKAAGMASPAIEAQYVASEYLGSSVMYFFEAADGMVIEVEHHLSLGHPPEYTAKEQYMLGWKPEDAIVFG